MCYGEIFSPGSETETMETMDMLEPTEETTFPVCGRMCHDVRMSKA
jgi:hypothetical protein